jgi:NAD(P)-dependent dehydrogenase (short-subunit alcohol dehydrogenase family)
MVPAMERFGLQGKVALVTGAARGIGLETAKGLARRGASVVLVDLDAAEAERAAAQVHDTRALGLGGDVTDRAAMQRAVAAAVERFGSLDVVVANAGIAPRAATMRAMAPENFERVIDVNLLGVARTVDAALPEIVRWRGHIVVIASVYAFANGAGAVPYAMSKAGVEALAGRCGSSCARTGRARASRTSGGSTPRWSGRGSTPTPWATRCSRPLPAPLRKRLPPSAAAAAIVDGIERRKARIVRPRRWAVVSALRGVLNPLTDRGMESDARIQGIVRDLDARGGEEQPTTA